VEKASWTGLVSALVNKMVRANLYDRRENVHLRGWYPNVSELRLEQISWAYVEMIETLHVLD
jgi:hypothetical protein